MRRGTNFLKIGYIQSRRKPMTKYLIVFAAAATLTAFAVPQAKAEIEYPWCAIYGGRGGGGTNCGFSTLQQCMATISGIGGSCERNPMYPSRTKRPHR